MSFDVIFVLYLYL